MHYIKSVREFLSFTSHYAETVQIKMINNDGDDIIIIIIIIIKGREA